MCRCSIITAKQVTNINAALLTSEHMGADGILGLDSLRSQRVLFDFKKQKLTLVPAEAYVREDKDTIVVTARVRNGRLILTQARAENTPLTLVVDTGAQVSIGNEALRRKLSKGQREADRPGRAAIGHRREVDGRIYDRPGADGRRAHAQEAADRVRRFARFQAARPRRSSRRSCSA